MEQVRESKGIIERESGDSECEKERGVREMQAKE